MTHLHGKVIEASELRPLLESVFSPTDLPDGPLPFTGITSHVISSPESIIDDSTGSMIDVNTTTLDIFGMVGKTPTVMRIKGWRPDFYVLIPVGVDCQVFAEFLQQKAYRYRIADIACVDANDFNGFSFGRTREYLRITTYNASDARKVANITEECFRIWWHRVECHIDGTTLRKDPSISLPDTKRLRLIHRREQTHWSLRFTNTLSEPGMIYQFMTQEKMPLVTHHTINAYTLFDPSTVGIKYKVGVEVKWDRDNPPFELRHPSMEEDYFRQCPVISYDLETLLSRSVGHNFSNPLIREDEIMTVGIAIYRVGEDRPTLMIALLPKDHPTTPIDDALTVMCDNEAEMIHVTGDIIEEVKGIVTGYNIDKFDNRYLYLRGQLLGEERHLLRCFSNYIEGGDERDVKFNANEKYKMDNGTKTGLHRIVSDQRLSLDAFLRLSKMRPKEFQEAENLNTMLKWYTVIDPETGEDMRKMDMPIPHMYKLWAENEKEGIHDVARYCAIDSKGVALLLNWLNILIESYDLAGATMTTLSDSLHRADGKRVRQIITWYGRKHDVMFADEIPPTGYRAEPFAGIIGGGDVKSLSPGLQRCIISLDYKSEYPAQKEAYNIGSSALVEPDMLEHPEDYDLVILHREEVADQYGSSLRPEWKTRTRYWMTTTENLSLVSTPPTLPPLPLDEKVSTSTPLPLDRETSTTRERPFSESDPLYQDGTIYRVEQFWGEGKVEGKTVIWPVYFAQSPRSSETGRITRHYSIQERLLTDLRMERDRVKGEMGKCDKLIKAIPLDTPAVEKKVMVSKFKANKVTYNARQGSVKVVMNTEYGWGNNQTSPGYNYHVSASTTWASRRLAEFLRRLLTCLMIIIPDYIVDKGGEHGVSPITRDNPTGCKSYFRDLVDKLVPFGFRLELVEGETPPSDRPAVEGELSWTHPDGSTMIDLFLLPPTTRWYRLHCTAAMLVYQDTDSNYYRMKVIEAYYSSISDPLDFVKATMHALLDHNNLFGLIVAGMINRWPIAVSCDGTFVTAYWSPLKKQYVGVKGPESHGGIDALNMDYLFPDLSDREQSEVIARYLERKHVKVTGFLLVRRETPDFVIEDVCYLLSELLAFREDNDAIAIAEKTIALAIEKIKHPTNLHSYSKQQKHKPGTLNDVKVIVDRLRESGREDLIPPLHSVVRYVLTIDGVEGEDGFHARGKKTTSTKRSRMRLLTEFEPDSEGNVPSYHLDAPNYITHLASAFSTLIFEELIRRYVDAPNTPPDRKRSMEKLLDTYMDVLAVGSGDRDPVFDELKNAATNLLVGKYYTVTGLSREHKKEYDQAVKMTSQVVIGTMYSEQILKRSLDVAYDHSTPTGELLDRLVANEVRCIRRSKGAITLSSQWCVDLIIGRYPSEAAREKRVAEEQDKRLVTFNTEYRNIVIQYGRLIEMLHTIDPQITAAVLAHRREGSTVTFAEVKRIILDAGLLEINRCISGLDLALMAFQRAVIDKDGLSKALMLTRRGFQLP